MTAQEIIEIIRAAGAETDAEVLAVLNDGAALAGLGIAELEAQQRAGVPDGYKLMPVRPTDEMIDAGCKQHTCEQQDQWYSNSEISEYDVVEIYQAMLAAAPAPKAQGQCRQRQNALIRGAAQEAEPRARHSCNMGVGCEEYGICYADAHDEPERCGREQAHQPAEVGVTDDMRQAVRWAPSSAYWSQRLFEFFGPDARDGIAALEKQLREAQAALTAAGGRDELDATLLKREIIDVLTTYTADDWPIGQEREVKTTDQIAEFIVWRVQQLAATQPAQEQSE